ncbi:hypothetical protein PspLS_04828 [Pyricularia sp. CBS 133598]|nr:hypothetical protein PspLS_04828 [Pyricularia sp. CBS 133598]
MTSAKLKVVVCGASGHTGQSIMDQLLASPAQFEVIALARPESVNKEIYQNFARRGAVVKGVDFKDTQAVATLLTGSDVVISCLTILQKEEEESLIEASHKARIGRYVPSFWATFCPPGGVMTVRDQKEEFLNRCKRLYLPYTVIDVGLWYQASIPVVPSGRLDKAVSLPDSVILGDGNAKTALTDVADIGKYVVRIISDPRTLNRLVCAYNEVTTQNEVRATVEELSGETIPKEYQSKEEIEEIISSATKELAQSPKNVGFMFKKYIMEYAYSRGIRGDNSPEHAKYLGYLDAKELYPDVEYTSVKDFVRHLLDGERDAPIHSGGQDHGANSN